MQAPKKKTLWISSLVLTALLFTGVGIVGYWLLDTKINQDTSDSENPEAEERLNEDEAENSLSEDTDEPQNQTEAEEDTNNQDGSDEADCSDYLIIKGDISEAEKSQICARVVEPAMMYYANLEDEDLVDIVVEPYNDSEDLAYSGSVNTTLSADGGGWLFGYKGESATDIWWHPPCETGAPTPEFTEEFRQEYPEIVEFCGQ